jgi:hypothetical protein
MTGSAWVPDRSCSDLSVSVSPFYDERGALERPEPSPIRDVYPKA